MSKWPEVPLGDVAPLVRRPLEINPDETYTEIGIRSFFRGTFHRRRVSGSEFSWQKLFRVAGGDLIFSNLMAWERAIAVATQADDGCVANHRMLTCAVDTRRAIPGFLHAFFRTEYGMKWISNASPGSIARNKTLSPSLMSRIPIPLPPLAKQSQVVDQLDATMIHINNRSRATETVQADLNAMLQVSFDRIAAGVPRCRMCDIAPLIRRSINVHPDENYPELGIRSFGRGTFHKPPLTGIEVGNKRLFEIRAGDLLFNIIFAWEGAIALARPIDDGRFGSHRFLTCVADRSLVTPSFLRYYLLSPQGMKAIGEASPGGAGRNRTLSIKGLEAIEVSLPSLDAQQWFDTLQVKAASARALQAEASEELKSLMPVLLRQIFAD